MESLRERAIAAYQKQQALMPHYKSVQVENWVEEEFGIDCDPVVWEAEWYGEVDLGEFTLWVTVFNDEIDAALCWRCPCCGQVDTDYVGIKDMASLGKALLHEREFCSQCGKPYVRD